MARAAVAEATVLVREAVDRPLVSLLGSYTRTNHVTEFVVPTPGGAAGAFHTATAASLIFLRPDMRREDAAAVSIAMHLVYFAPAVIFGLYYFFHGDISIERFRSLLSSEHAVEEIESEAPNSNGQLTTDNGQSKGEHRQVTADNQLTTDN